MRSVAKLGSLCQGLALGGILDLRRSILSNRSGARNTSIKVSKILPPEITNESCETRAVVAIAINESVTPKFAVVLFMTYEAQAAAGCY